MKKLAALTLALILSLNISAMPLTEVQKVKLSISEASQTLSKDVRELKSLVLENALSTLSNDSEIAHETEVVLEKIEGKFPHKSQREMLALLSSTLLSDSEKQ